MKTDELFRRILVWLWIILPLWLTLGCERRKDARPQETGTAPAGTTAPLESGSSIDTGPPLDEPEVESEHTRGVAFMGQFDYNAAHTLFAELASRYPQWQDVAIDLAIAKLNRRQGTDAEDSAAILDRVIQRAPTNLRAKYCRALLLYHNGEVEPALALFQSVAAADPKDAYAKYFAGQCLFDMGKFEDALAEFQSAQSVDPYLRSTYYGAFQALQRLERPEDAMGELELFQRLATNPQARSAEIKYSRMGPKAEARPIAASSPRAVSLPAGPTFEAPTPIAVAESDDVEWATFTAWNAPTVTACDIDANGTMDLFVAGSVRSAERRTNAVLLRQEHGGWHFASDHPLARVDRVNAVLWGDIDNDGVTDAYLCRNGANQLWQQDADRDWTDVTQAAQADAGDRNTVDGAVFDADHDGDLDLLLIHANGTTSLLNNNLDGTFRSIGKDQGIGGDGRPAVGLAIADLDQDRDADIVILKSEAPHDIFLNDRLWNYTDSRQKEGDPFAALRRAAIATMVAVDTDADGQVELITGSSDGFYRWQPDAEGVWAREPAGTAGNEAGHLSASDPPLQLCGPFANGTVPLAVKDLNGDGRMEIVTGQQFDALREEKAAGPFALVLMEPRHGYSAVAAVSGRPPWVWQPGSGRFEFAAFRFTGQESKTDQMRSNASGIGVNAAARWAGRWTSLQTFRDQSGPGQSLQPVPVGLGGHAAIDYMQMHWPDGLFQTELGLAVGKTHVIEETQRQVSSCPVLFVWDGAQFTFVSDVLGVGGLGFNLADGEYHAPRPWEHMMLPQDQIASDRGEFRLKIGEPMEETCYLDSARLVAYDIPSDWQVCLDERQSTGAPEPTGDLLFFRETIPYESAFDRQDRNVMRQIAARDGIPAPTAPRDRRFLGRTELSQLTLKFCEPLREASDVGKIALVMDGWIEYPYSQTMFAAWQASAAYEPPTLEARAPGGEWTTVYAKFGYPAGMPREMALPIRLQDLPAGATELRLSSTLEIYWDRIRLVRLEQAPPVKRHACRLAECQLQVSGFPQRTNSKYRKPNYSYDNRLPLWDTRHHPGFYTQLGAVRPLVADTDDAVAVFGPGEEVELTFKDSLPQVPAGMQRRFVLELNGWCKDRDLYTQNGETLGPLPRSGKGTPVTERRRDALHKQFQTRYRVQ